MLFSRTMGCAVSTTAGTSDQPATPTGRNRLDRRSLFVLLGLLLFSLTLHLIIVTYGNVLVSDEHFYVPEAKSIIHERQLLDQVHPSLGKLLIAGGMLIFGDNPWGWRVMPVIFGTCAVALFYFICLEIAGKRTAFVASVFLITENLIFLNLGLAMLDVFSFNFMLLSFLFYLRKRYVLSGATLALSGLCKFTGFFGILVILGHWFLVRQKHETKRNIALLLTTGILAFVLIMPLTDFLATGNLMNPFGRILDMLFRTAGTTMGNLSESQLQYARYPWDWLMSPRADTLVTLFYYRYVATPTVWLLIIPSIVYMAYEWFSRRRKAALFVLLWFGATYLPWVALSLIFDRVTYLYYFFPALASICVALGFAVQRMWANSGKAAKRLVRWVPRSVIVMYLSLHVVVFYSYSPLIGVLTPSLLPS